MAISVRVPRLAKALRLDELVVLTSAGDILGAAAPGRVGQRDAALLVRVARAKPEASVQGDGRALTVDAAL